MPDLTEFQTRAEHAVNVLLEEKGLQTQREVLVGTIPFLTPEEQLVVHIGAGRVDLWLYDDEATISVDESDDRFERVAFDSTDALLASLLTTLRSRLETGVQHPRDTH